MNIKICEKLIANAFPYPEEFTTKDVGILLEKANASTKSAPGFCTKLIVSRKIKITRQSIGSKDRKPTRYFSITENCSPYVNDEKREGMQGLLAQTVILAMGRKN